MNKLNYLFSLVILAFATSSYAMEQNGKNQKEQLTQELSQKKVVSKIAALYVLKSKIDKVHNEAEVLKMTMSYAISGISQEGSSIAKGINEAMAAVSDKLGESSNQCEEVLKKINEAIQFDADTKATIDALKQLSVKSQPQPQQN
jgi:hypothetical protein